MKARRGYTYIELTVTLVVLLLIVGLVMPNLKHLAEGQEIASFKTDLKTLPVSAREYAVSRGQTVQVAYDDGNSEITISAIEETSSTSDSASSRNTLTSALSTSSDDTEGTELRTITVPSTVKATTFMLEGSDADASSWSLRFYADGTSEAGGIGFEARDYKFALTVRDDGRGATVDGDIPDLSTEKWTAGDYEQRTE